MITHKQLTLAEIFEDCQNKFDNDKYQFLSLLDEAINLDEIVPVSFVSHFHASTGRPRSFPAKALSTSSPQNAFHLSENDISISFMYHSISLSSPF